MMKCCFSSAIFGLNCDVSVVASTKQHQEVVSKAYEGLRIDAGLTRLFLISGFVQRIAWTITFRLVKFSGTA